MLVSPVAHALKCLLAKERAERLKRYRHLLFRHAINTIQGTRVYPRRSPLADCLTLRGRKKRLGHEERTTVQCDTRAALGLRVERERVEEQPRVD